MTPSASQGLALIFDLDGVVVDSMPVHTLAWERYLERLGIHSPEIVAQMHGRRNDEIVRMFVDSNTAEAVVHGHGAAKEQLFRDLIGADLASHLVPGLGEFLTSAAGTPLGVASNAEPANVNFVLDFVLNEAALRTHFQVVADGTAVERDKPFPDIYLHVAERLGVRAENCVVFEDSPVGILAARRAGMRVVGLLTHSESLDDTDISVKNFLAPELKPWLAQQHSR